MTQTILARGDYLGATLGRRETAGVLLTLTEYRPNLLVGEHAHEHPGFFMLVRGQHRETNRQGVIDQEPTSAIFHQASAPHSTATGPNGMVGLNISFHSSWLGSMDIYPSQLKGYAASRSKEVRLSALKLLSAGLRPSTSDEDVETMALGLLGELTHDTEKVAPKWLAGVREMIEDRYGEAVSLGALAKEVSVHPNYLARVFRRFYGCSVYEYLHRVRLLRATQLIQSGVSIGVAAAESGFSDQAHLNRICRRDLCTTPGQLRSLLHPTA